MAAELPTGGLIYGVRLRSEFVYRYVGLTTKSIEIRVRQHVKLARSGRKTPFYDWLRVHGVDDIVVDVLDRIEGLRELGQAEVDWIDLLRQEGHPLLNLSQGGLGPMGIEWTATMRGFGHVMPTTVTAVLIAVAFVWERSLRGDQSGNSSGILAWMLEKN